MGERRGRAREVEEGEKVCERRESDVEGERVRERRESDVEGERRGRWIVYLLLYICHNPKNWNTTCISI